jgi:peptidoglycan/xylan/chitin deacetylase (PgdA/CDA1 family)
VASPERPQPKGLRFTSRIIGLADSIRVRAGGRLGTPGAVILTYHDIDDGRGNPTSGSVSVQRLRRHLTAAMDWGLRFVDLGELVSSFLDNRSVDGLASVVFDDSLVGVHHHAMPVLLELGLPATVFTVSDALGASPPWWDGAARLMTRAEVEEMAAAGFRIASHSRTHVSLPSVSPDILHDELAGSRHQLEDMVGAAVDLFAYPNGEHDPRVRAAVADAAYRAAFIFLNGRIVGDLDPLRLPRLAMGNQTRSRLAYDLARPVRSWRDTQLAAVSERR